MSKWSYIVHTFMMLRMCQASGSSSLENNVQLISAVVIIFEHSFFVFDKRRYLEDQRGSVPSVDVALEQYIASPHVVAVKKAVRAAVRTCQGNSSTWKAKLPFGGFQKKEKQSIQCAELIKTVVEITLEHRLPRP
ncbi:hypothetical protein BDR03DRAFT_1096111 [Suillus americanus]|nr:hypothetical protein BDR03DRAFT_1096111 [Suillus americanus]